MSLLCDYVLYIFQWFSAAFLTPRKQRRKETQGVIQSVPQKKDEAFASSLRIYFLFTTICNVEPSGT